MVKSCEKTAGELGRDREVDRKHCFQYLIPVYQLLVSYDWCLLAVFVNLETKKTHSERVKPSYTADFEILTFFIFKLAG